MTINQFPKVPPRSRPPKPHRTFEFKLGREEAMNAVLIILVVTACIGFLTGVVPEEKFMVVVGGVLFYFFGDVLRANNKR